MINKKIYYPLEENKKIILDLFGKSFAKDIENDKLDIKTCVDANNILSEILYGKKIFEALKNENLKILENEINKLKEENEYKFNISKNFDFKNIGMLVIRPENIGIIDKYEEFLKKNGLSIIYKKKIILTFEQYLLLYYHGLIPKESRYDFPTRTLNYINKECYLLIVYSNNKLLPVSDYLISIKGKQGKNQKNTLRGDIAFNELKNFISNDGVHFNIKIHNLLFDPIGMCRLLVREQINSDLAHNKADLKLLYYVGQAVHVPDSSEIVSDFSVLCDLDDFDLIDQKVKKIKSRIN